MNTLREPLFFLCARSFWLGLAAFAVYTAGDTAVAKSYLFALEPVLGWDVEVLHAWVVRAAPSILAGWAYLERSGMTSQNGTPRPLTVDPRAWR